MEAEGVRGRVFDIERYATEDGPGIRTVVFLKGCPLRCKWCSNPESIRSEIDILFYKSRCVKCNKCVENCPTLAISASEKYGLVTDMQKCTACGLCERECFYDARKLSGISISAGEVMKTVLKDKMYYDKSGGGITISGGEPFAQSEFMEALLKLARKNGISTAVETSGMLCQSDKLDRILPLLDLVYLDIKHIDAIKLKKQVGAKRDILLGNIRDICGKHKNIILRIPCIPGFNHSKEDMQQILGFIKTLGKNCKRVELLPYHRLGRDKYACLGREYPMGETQQLDKDALSGYVQEGSKMGLSVSIGAI